MSYAVWVVMDPIEHIKTSKDSTFAMLLEAQRRGLDVRYVEPGGLAIRDGVARARVAPVRVIDRAEDWFSLGDYQDVPFSHGQVVLMRKDPPVDAEFIHDTHILSMAELQGALVVNAPAALRNFNEKLAAQLFPQCCTPTLVTRQRADLKAFVKQQGRAVLKPLDGMGGRSIFQANADDPNLNVILETLAGDASHLVMAQKYVPEIVDGDKRILIVDGEVVPYCLARIPQGDEFRGNLAAGGRAPESHRSSRDGKRRI